MNEITDRIISLKGTPREVGYDLGRLLANRIEATMERYLHSGPLLHETLDVQKLKQGSVLWLENLPERFKEEIQGIAEGAHIPVERLAEWYFSEDCVDAGCTGIIVRRDEGIWVARNNDYLAPELWGYACVREISGRIPVIGFGREGDVFTVMVKEKNLLFLSVPVHNIAVEYWRVIGWLVQIIISLILPGRNTMSRLAIQYGGLTESRN